MWRAVQHELCQAAREVHTLSRRVCSHAASQCTEGQESCLKKVPQSREKRDGYALDEKKTSGYPGMGSTVAEGEPASRTEVSRTKKMVPKTGNTMLPNRGNTILQKVPKKREERENDMSTCKTQDTQGRKRLEVLKDGVARRELWGAASPRAVKALA